MAVRVTNTRRDRNGGPVIPDDFFAARHIPVIGKSGYLECRGRPEHRRSRSENPVMTRTLSILRERFARAVLLDIPPSR